MRAYYNEIDLYCCDWLQNLMDAGLITPGKIDDRDIREVQPDDVRGYERVHFFAGIAGWDYALSLSGYTGPVWTGSCPCQPFSAAGKGKASGDERHLWPEWFRLIRAVRPPAVFGEQVEAAIGWGWLDLVHTDLEAEGYTVGAAVLPACSVGAPHIRQRLWFVANNERERRREERPNAGRLGAGDRAQGVAARLEPSCNAGELADAQCGTKERWRHDLAEATGGIESEARERQRLWDGAGTSGATGGLADPERDGGRADLEEREAQGRETDGGLGRWHNLIWLPCTDGKQRPTQPGIFPLAHGISARVAKLRAAGNAIVPQVAAEFIKATIA